MDTATLTARPLDVTHRGTSKVSHYGWSLKDRPGDFAMLPKEQLIIDPSYQRTMREDRVLRMAREWSWISCGVLLVALRPKDAAYAVIDGQHRQAAAMSRSDIAELPCLIFEVDHISAEAGGFLSANTARRPLSMVDRYKALRITDDAGAAVVAKLVEQAGRTVSMTSGATTLTCIGTIMTCAKQNSDALERVWPVIVSLCEGQSITNDVVRGVFFLETHLEDGASLTHPRWRQRLLASGYRRVVE